jgi:trehalose/maltose transport system substrate-binding protein
VEESKLLVPFVSGITIFCFCVLWLIAEFISLRKEKSRQIPFEPLIATLGSLVALIVLPNFQENQLWLSLVIFATAVVILSWMQTRLRGVPKKMTTIAIGIFIIANLVLIVNYNANSLQGVTIKVMLQTEEGESSDNYATASWENARIAQFEQKSGVNVNLVPVKKEVNQRLSQFQKELNPQDQNRTEDEVDVLAIDVTWLKALSIHGMNLSSEFKEIEKQVSPKILENNKVNNQLIAVPWYVDAGLLFYREDLLKEHLKRSRPPKTWQELEEWSQKIQTAERAKGNEDFWGFVWSSNPSESLTCNALEWQISNGGGSIIREKNGKAVIDINVEATTEAFQAARNWIQDNQISPQQENYDRRAAFDTWRQGNAAFMRNWLYAYNDTFKRQVDGPDFIDKVGVTLLPKGNHAGATQTSTMGGWQLMINQHSQGKESKAAIEFVKFLVSKESQKSLAETGKVPALKELYKDGDILQRLPFLGKTPILDLVTGESQYLAKRPSITGDKYQEISRIYYEGVDRILHDKVVDVQEAVIKLRNSIQKELSRQ